MKRALPTLLATGLVAGLIGCQPAAESPSLIGDAATTTTTTNAVSSDLTLVSLSVPNMT